MKCSWKIVLLLALVSVVIQYVAIRSFASITLNICSVLHLQNPLHLPQMDASCLTYKKGSIKNTSQSHILILAATRSGSSFLGQLFNHHPDVFYLYEPLNHIQTALNATPANRRTILGASRDLLRGLFRCDLHFLEDYISPQPQDHITDQLKRRGASKALCTPPVCEAFGPLMVNMTERQCVQTCSSLNLTLASESCQRRGHVVIKTVRVPEVSDVRDLLEDPRLNLKVIQLVRDPRGVLASRMTAFPNNYPLMRLWKMRRRKPEGLKFTQEPVCEDYLRSVTTALKHPDWLRGRYMLVRYEDLAKDPLQKTGEIFKFLDMDLTKSVVDWIDENTHGRGSWSPMDVLGTNRDSATTSDGWRQKLSYDMVEYLQSLCHFTLQELGYKFVSSSDELRNLSLSLLETKSFQTSL